MSPLLQELLDELDMFLVDHPPLLATDPDGFYVRLRGFAAYLICRSMREGRTTVIRWEPGKN